MNKTILCGRLTSDPELRQTQSGVSTCRFTVAVDRKFANKETGEREADFISCQAWRNTADFVSRYFTKGKMIIVEGSLRTSTYQDKKYPDVKHYATDVFVDNVEFAGDKGAKNPNEAVARPAEAMVQQTQAAGIPTEGYGNLSDFEDILSDGDVPF